MSTVHTADTAQKRNGAVGQVSVTRSIGMPDGSRISVVRKDVMDHALGRANGDAKK